MRLFIYRIICFAALFYTLNSVVAVRARQRLKNDHFNKYHWICGLQGNEYDFVFAGSSRSAYTVLPDLVDERLGTHSVNIGVSGGGAADNFLLLDSIIQNNSVKTVVLQLDHLTLSNDLVAPFRDHVWLSYQDSDAVQTAIIKNSGWFNYLRWNGFPFLPLMEFSSQYRYHASIVGGESWVKSKGSQTRDVVFQDRERKVLQYKPNEISIFYVREIFEICATHQIELIIYQAPYYAAIEEHASREQCDELLYKLIDQYDIRYWDYSEAFLGNQGLFCDHHHLNARGMKRFTEMLCERLENLELLNEGETTSREINRIGSRQDFRFPTPNTPLPLHRTAVVDSTVRCERVCYEDLLLASSVTSKCMTPNRDVARSGIKELNNGKVSNELSGKIHLESRRNKSPDAIRTEQH